MLSATILAFCFVWQKPSACERYQPFLDQLADAYFAKRPMTNRFTGDLDEARELRDCLAERLEEKLGPIIGYKAALTSEAAQKRFGAAQPLLGLIFEKMVQPDGARLSIKFGAVPLCEADLVVRVGDDRINRARDEAEAMAAIDAIIPFLELPDAIYGSDVVLNGPSIVAVNAGARLGILGEPIAITDPMPWLEKLNRIEAILLDEKGALIERGEARALMGHPLKAVLWIRDALAAEGKSLKKGDLLSLGAITRPLPIRSPGVVIARYKGLDSEKNIDIRVVFVE